MAARCSFSRQSPRRSTSWEGANITLISTTGLSVFQEVVSEAIIEQITKPTVVRIRGEINFRLTAQGAGVTSSNQFVGIKVATASAIAAGIASLELSATGIGSDWIWWYCTSFQTTTSSEHALGADSTTNRVVIDLKAMRKVGSNQALILVAQNVALVSTQTVGMTGGIRVLLKE